MQIAARIGASLGDVTPYTGVASAVGALQELGLTSLTGKLRVGDCLLILRAAGSVAGGTTFLQLKALVLLAICAAVGSSQ